MILSGFISLILSSVSFAAPPICSKLSAATCTEGVRNDGTGSTLVSDSSAFAASEREKMKPTIRRTFQQLLTTPAGQALIPQIMAACRIESRDENQLVNCLSSLYTTTEDDPALGSLYEKEDLRIQFSAEEALQLVQNRMFKDAASSITRSTVGTIPNELISKVEKEIFPTVQNLLRQRIRELPIDEPTKSELERKVANIKFGAVQCGRTSVDYSSQLLQALYPNASYTESSGTNSQTISICPAYLRYSTSEFDLASMIAHELAHSIDPCKLGGDVNGGEFRAMSEADSDKAIEDRYLRKDFISCLRSPTSIGARSERPLDPPRDSEIMVANGFNRFCQADQINESVADWFAAETLAAYIPHRNSKLKTSLSQAQVQSGMANVLRSFCSADFNHDRPKDDPHAPTVRRIDSIYLVQPKLRELMGCPKDLPGKRYCDVQNPASLISTPQQRSTPRTSEASEARQ